jgi:hypothetical protein
MRRTSDDVGSLGRRGNPAQRWLHICNGGASVHSSPGLAESTASEAIVQGQKFSLIETGAQAAVVETDTQHTATSANMKRPFEGTRDEIS